MDGLELRSARRRFAIMNTVLYFERSAVLRPSSLPATDPTSPLLAQRFSPPLSETPPTRYGDSMPLSDLPASGVSTATAPTAATITASASTFETIELVNTIYVLAARAPRACSGLCHVIGSVPWKGAAQKTGDGARWPIGEPRSFLRGEVAFMMACSCVPMRFSLARPPHALTSPPPASPRSTAAPDS